MSVLTTGAWSLPSANGAGEPQPRCFAIPKKSVTKALGKGYRTDGNCFMWTDWGTSGNPDTSRPAYYSTQSIRYRQKAMPEDVIVGVSSHNYPGFNPLTDPQGSVHTRTKQLVVCELSGEFTAHLKGPLVKGKRSWIQVAHAPTARAARILALGQRHGV